MRHDGLMIPLRRLFERRLRAQLTSGALPRHVGLVMDGNRRWARQMGMSNPSLGHRYGAEHVDEVLGWCRELGIDNVTVYVASVDKLRKRDPAEVDYLLDVIETLVLERLAGPDASWQLHVAGRLDVVPDSTAHALKLGEELTRDCTTGAHITMAVGYDGRMEIVDAVRSLLDDEARSGRKPWRGRTGAHPVRRFPHGTRERACRGRFAGRAAFADRAIGPGCRRWSAGRPVRR